MYSIVCQLIADAKGNRCQSNVSLVGMTRLDCGTNLNATAYSDILKNCVFLGMGRIPGVSYF